MTERGDKMQTKMTHVKRSVGAAVVGLATWISPEVTDELIRSAVWCMEKYGRRLPYQEIMTRFSPPSVRAEVNRLTSLERGI